MSNKIPINIFWNPEWFFSLMLSNKDFKILPFEKLTFANLDVETLILLFIFLNSANLCSIKYFETPRKLDRFTVLSVEIENTCFNFKLSNFFRGRKFIEFVENIYLVE